MSANKYLLTAATLAGVAAGSIGTGALTARAGIPTRHRANLPAVEVARATFGGLTQLQTVNGICDKMEEQFGLDAGSCSITDVEGYCVQINEADGTPMDPVVVRAIVGRDMTLVDGAPE